MAAFVLLRSTLVALLCVQTAKTQSAYVVAKLWADGTRIPDGYVVPVEGDITFTCRHNDSLTRSLFWEIVIVNGTVMTPTTALFLGNEPGLSSPATGNTDNPVNLTVHNLQLGNNGSTVRCSVEVEGSPAIILVEGVPSCPVLNLSSLTAEVSSLSVTWTAAEHTLLPVWYQVMVSASDNYTWSQETTTNHINISTSRPLQLASTAYNISVTTCNKAGCKEGCPVYTTDETATEDTGDVIVRNLQGWTIGLISLCAILFVCTITIAVAAIVKVMTFHAKPFDSGAKEGQGTKGQEEIKGAGDTKKEQI